MVIQIHEGGIALKILKLLLPILKYTFVIIIIILSTGPLIWVLASSLKSNGEILMSPVALPLNFRYYNYINAFKLAPIAQFYLNSVIIAIFGTVLNLVVLGMSAYVFARYNFRFKKLLISVIASSLLIPGAALLQPLFITVSTLGLYDKLLGLIIVYAGFGLPASFYILSSYYLTIPKELDESAFLDGAGFIRTFLSIILPVSKPGFGTAGVLQFLLCWNEFQFALTLTSGNKSRTLPISLYYFKTQFSSDYGAMFAAVVIVIIPSIIIYILLQEQVVSGLAAGAVKG